MGAFDFQLGFKDESTFATAVTVDRFAEYNGDVVPIVGQAGRTEANPLRVGSRARRAGRVVPYFDHAEGTVPLDVMDKGFGFWLKHLLPSVAATGGEGEDPHVYTATEGGSSASVGKSFTCQINAPFHPSGTNQALTFAGGKIPKWTLHCAVDEMLTLDADMWFAKQATGTALATASYPSGMANFAWVHGVIKIADSAVDLTSFSLEVDQGYKLDRAAIRGDASKKEPTPGVLGITWSATADWDALTQFNRVHATTVADISAEIEATFTNGDAILVATIPSARFDTLSFSGDVGALQQDIGGVGEYNGTDSPVTLAYTTTDDTP